MSGLNRFRAADFFQPTGDVDPPPEPADTPADRQARLTARIEVILEGVSAPVLPEEIAHIVGSLLFPHFERKPDDG